MLLTRRSVLLSLAAASIARPAQAQAISLAELSRYFNGFQTLSAGFTQIASDGSRATGRLFIQRPGRARFEYDPPERSLVMAGGSQLAVFDARSNQGPNQYPLRQTPLNLILERHVDLENRRMVVGHSSDGCSTTVIAQDPERPQYGSIRLIFSAGPVTLREWIIRDDTGRETRVILNNLRYGEALSARFFNISAEIEARRRAG